MQRLFNRVSLGISLASLALFLCVCWEVYGVILYADWVEHRRISHLTQEYNDELLEPVQRYANSFTINNYPDNQEEFNQYATGPSLQGLKETLEIAQRGKSVIIITNLDLSSSQVVFYTDQTARLVIKEQLGEVIYDSTGVEIINKNYRVTLVGYDLLLEDGVWKVNQGNSCGLENDDECIRDLKSGRNNWLDNKQYGDDYSVVLKIGEYLGYLLSN